jgi:hypothetical protein
MMEQALNKGQQQNALELAQLAPVELKALLPLSRRSMAKQYADAAYSLLSPAGAAAPGFCPDAPSSIWPGRY